ncbi:hypothetical protein [Burkholderia seminalis]
MRDADQSTFDVVATVPAATLRCTMPSRNTACVARWKIPMNTIAPSPSRDASPSSSIDENRMRRAATRQTRVATALCASAKRTMPFARRIARGNAFSHTRSRTLSSTSGAATVLLANAGNQEQDRCARNDLFERAAAAVALEQVG